jgi:hypothetical protein
LAAVTVVLYGCLAGILLGAVNVAALLAMRRFPDAELGGLVTAAIALPLLVAITAASGAGADDVEAGSASSADAHPVSRSRPGARFTARIRAMSAGKRFTLFGFPLKISPGTGSPVRLVAAVPVS